MDASDSETRIGPLSQSGTTGGFAPGTILADRYRIVAQLGRGGMGEVYRADDLRLGQPVALKFLPESVAQDPDARERLFAEARNARSIAHPHVCRVYDVGEMAFTSIGPAGTPQGGSGRGRLFLTMEYIDGEDLASLLRRIGRLPGPKASEIARQLCAGLEAAHERGVLHRDLKPANVMIDGRGHARITDFGLAVDTRQAASAREFAGTVAYMAPERLHGQPATVQSDLYALGLILYETFTGKPAFKASTLDEWLAVHDRSTPDRPSQWSSEIDPATERIILQCLSKDPAARPASARQIAAALPGGDPLAAALAAGETPSPELVAASGAEGTLPRRTAWALLMACVVSLAAAGFIWQWTSLAGLVPFEGSPEVLRAKARTILREIRHEGAAEDHGWDIVPDGAHLRYLATERRDTYLFDRVGQAIPAPLTFRFRQSPEPLRPLGITGMVMFDDPPPGIPGESQITLDSMGRLTSLRARPVGGAQQEGLSAEPDWSPVLSAMGLGGADLQEAVPARIPPFAAEVRRAWTAAVNGERVTVEAAAYRGRIVYAERFGVWQQSQAGGRVPPVGLANRPAQTLLAVLWMATLAAVALLARRNVNMGRGDLRGAMRVAAVMLAGGIAFSIAGRHWVFDAFWLWMVVSTQLGGPLFNAALVWLFYLGLEPSARRYWPRLLVGWTRMLEGRWRDPLVGQGLLAGVLLGTLLPVVATLPELGGRFFGVAGAHPSFWIASLSPAMNYLSAVGGMALMGLKNSLGILGFMVVARFLLKRDMAVFAATAFVAALAATSGVAPFALDLTQAAVGGVATVLFFRRFGLLALAVGLGVNYVVRQTPWTLDYSRWFAWRPGLTCAIIVGVMVWGFVSVLGRQSAFAAPDFDA
jgi:serine/threonine-protein kinase